MTQKTMGVFAVVIMVMTLMAMAAEPESRPSTGPSTSNSPRYPIPYRVPRVDGITRQLQAIRNHLDAIMMTTLTTRPSDAPVPRDGRRQAVIGYPMGVVYSGMISAADATGDKAFADFDTKRFQLLADGLAKLDLSHLDRQRGSLVYLLNPRSLDDCGAMGASLVKARRAGVGPDLKVIIDHIAQYISHKQLRLDDGMLARPRPMKQSIWSDDSYMSIPFLAQMGALTGDKQYIDDAAAQMLDFENYLFVPSIGLFTHHWNEANPDNQPKYYWGRANGWCTVSLVELLDVLPEDHPMRGRILRLLRTHAEGIAGLQSGEGLWHQMLDRNDSYTETSCSAMFVYALARAVNHGWLDAGQYGPVALVGWQGLTTRISDDGHITGTCIGTSFADDYVYYYHRPQTDDIHGYGPTLLAGSEVIRLLKNPHFRIVGGERGSPIMVLDRNAVMNPPEP